MQTNDTIPRSITISWYSASLPDSGQSSLVQDGHSVMVLGYTLHPRGIIVADPQASATTHLESRHYHCFGSALLCLPEHMEGHQYQLVVLNDRSSEGCVQSLPIPSPACVCDLHLLCSPLCGSTDSAYHTGELSVGISWQGKEKGWKVDEKLAVGGWEAIKASCSEIGFSATRFRIEAPSRRIGICSNISRGSPSDHCSLYRQSADEEGTLECITNEMENEVRSSVPTSACGPNRRRYSCQGQAASVLVG